MDVKRNRILPVIIVIFLIFVVGGSSFLYHRKHRDDPSTEMARPENYYASEEGKAALIANGNLSKVTGVWKDQTVYLPLSIVMDELNGNFYWSGAEKLLFYNAGEKIFKLNETLLYNNSAIYFLREGVEEDEITKDDIYVSLNYVAANTNLQVDIYSEPARAFIRNRFDGCTYGNLVAGTEVRVAADDKAAIITKLQEDRQVWIISGEAGWSKVYVDGTYGHMGYVKDEMLTEQMTKEDPGPNPAKVLPHVKVEEPISLVWHQVFRDSGIDAIDRLLDRTKDLTVLAPTWFSIMNTEGDISSRANRDYVDLAHERGLKVWALAENINTTEHIDYTQLFGLSETRTKMIDTMIGEALNYGIDGINLDIEGLPSTAGDDYLQFVRELAVACHNNGLVISVDNYVPSAWTSHYHRAEQAEVIDYFIIMAYDEHYNGSEAGSTASQGFVADGVANTIEAGVPEDMIILALPFYARLWKGDGSTLSSETIDMDHMQALLEREDVNISWDDQCGQFFVEMNEEGEVNRCWIENTDSYKAKLNMVDGYDLAGLAGWKLGMDNTAVWDVISEYLYGGGEE